MSLVDFLPVELWEKVLEHLTGSQLLDVSLVCKKLYEIIGVSKKLMNKLSLSLTILNVERIDKCLNQSKRKYSNLTLDGLTRVSIDLKKLLHHQSRNIASVKISNCTLNPTRVKHLLNPISKTLRNLTLCNVKLMNESQITFQLSFICLQKVCIMACIDNTIVSTLKMICDANICEFFFMSNTDVNVYEASVVMEFLSTQRKIRSLVITGEAAGRLMRLEKFLPFKLESLCIEFASGSDTEHVSRFLMKHKTSLTSLSLGRMTIDSELIDCLASFNQLRCSRFSECSFKPNQSFVKNNYVKKVFLSGISADNEQMICKLLSSMQTVREIYFQSFEVTFNVCLSIAYDMKHLARLTLNKCEINPFTFVNVKRLKFIEGERDDIIKMILVNRQIEMLEIDRTYQHCTDFQDAFNKLAHATISFSS